jgi:hypothetical protein
MNKEQPILRFFKRIMKSKSFLYIPKEIINKFGYEYYLEVYSDRIELRPYKKTNNKENK